MSLSSNQTIGEPVPHLTARCMILSVPLRCLAIVQATDPCRKHLQINTGEQMIVVGQDDPGIHLSANLVVKPLQQSLSHFVQTFHGGQNHLVLETGRGQHIEVFGIGEMRRGMPWKASDSGSPLPHPVVVRASSCGSHTQSHLPSPFVACAPSFVVRP